MQTNSMFMQTVILLITVILSTPIHAAISEKDMKNILVKELKGESLAEPSSKKWNPISYDFNEDKKTDEVIWLKNKAGNDHFVLLLAEKDTYRVISLVQYDSNQKFCGDISIKKPNEKGISDRTYFFTDDDRPAALKKKTAAIKKYVPALSIEISTDLKSSSDNTWMNECYCTTGIVFHQNKTKSYSVCD